MSILPIRIAGPVTVVSAVVGAAGVPWALARWVPPADDVPFTYSGIGVSILMAAVAAVLLIAPTLVAQFTPRLHLHLLLAAVSFVVSVFVLWKLDPIAVLVRLDLWIGVWASAIAAWVVLAISGFLGRRGEKSS